MSGGKHPKGKFHPLVWSGEGRCLGLLSAGLWFAGPLVFPNFGLLCWKQNGAAIQLDFFVLLIETGYKAYTYLKLVLYIFDSLSNLK